MRWGYMPDDLANGGNYNPNCSGNIHYGGISNACKSNMGSGVYLASSQLNNSYHNPQLTYSPPLNPDGNQYPNASFTKDRKSTHLNSSHVALSYAVFCL